eukprot:SAG11_NODE_4142_length_2042_cov_4.977869_1_plen_157_part_00
MYHDSIDTSDLNLDLWVYRGTKFSTNFLYIFLWYLSFTWYFLYIFYLGCRERFLDSGRFHDCSCVARASSPCLAAPLSIPWPKEPVLSANHRVSRHCYWRSSSFPKTLWKELRSSVFWGSCGHAPVEKLGIRGFGEVGGTPKEKVWIPRIPNFSVF